MLFRSLIKLCLVYGDKTLSKRQFQNWFKEFIGCAFFVINKQRLGRPVEVYEKEIKEIINTDRHSTTPGISEKLNVSHTCVEKRLQQMGYPKKMDLWISHEIKE